MAPGSNDPRGHAWWTYVPTEERRRRLRFGRRSRLRALISSRPSRMVALILVYALFAALPWLFGSAGITGIQLLPLLLLPALGVLAWWLTWKEFHQ